MKKLLLLACVAIAAITANAQKIAAVDKAQNLTVNKFQPKAAQSFKLADNLKVKTISEAFAQKKVTKKALPQSSIYGEYVEDNMEEFHVCSPAEITPYIYKDEETGQEYELVNIALSDGVTVLLGEYDEEEGVIYLPVNALCGEHKTYGRFALYGIDDEDMVITEGAITLTVDQETGNLYLDQAGYAIYMVDFSEQQGSGQWWSVNFGTCFFKTNATQDWYQALSGDWEEQSATAAIEDYETNLNIYSFLNLGFLTVDIADDLSVKATAKQPIIPLSWFSGISEDELALYGPAMNFTPVKSYQENGQNYITRDWDAEYVNGAIIGDTLYLATFCLASNPDETGAAYGYGWYSNYAIALNNGSFAAGIRNVEATREEKIKNTKTYNLMGQQVNRSEAKGILIRNGKKFLKK